MFLLGLGLEADFLEMVELRDGSRGDLRLGAGAGVASLENCGVLYLARLVGVEVGQPLLHHFFGPHIMSFIGDLPLILPWSHKLKVEWFMPVSLDTSICFMLYFWRAS